MWALLLMMSVMLMPVLPHHHHYGVACMAMEYCARDNAVNDRHTHHHGDNTSCGAESNCYISAKLHTDRQQPVRFLHPAAYTAVAAIAAFSELNGKICKRVSVRYKSVDLYRVRPLRAPPVV